MRNQFDHELALLNTELIEMGALIENAIGRAVDALIKKDEAFAEAAIEFDHEVDQKEHDIETHCLKLLLHQQPVARDLRLISSALKMITDMERIGDQASDIAEITLRLTSDVDLQKLENISAMAKATIKMVRDSIDAFVSSDLEQANGIIEYDDVVDQLFNNVRDDLIVMIKTSQMNGEEVVDLLMIAKYFERIGDHAVNIAEWVVFSITGEHKSNE